MKYLKYYILILIILLNIKIVFSQNNDNTTDSTDDLPAKKTKYFSFYFYSINEYNVIFDNKDIYTLTRSNETDFTFNNKFNNSYSFNYYINNIVYLDFYELYYVYQFNKDYPYLLNQNDIILNSFSTGIENEFNITKILKIYLNFDFIFYSTTNQYFSNSISPYIKISGDYYTGFFFDVKEYFTYEIIGNDNYQNSISIDDFKLGYNYQNSIITNYLKLGYEFFRYYGPRKFRLTILAENELILTFPSDYYPFKLSYELEAGLFLSYYNIKNHFYYTMNMKFDLSNSLYYYNYIGFKTGIDLNVYKFKFSVFYLGSIDLNDIEKTWFNEIEAIFKFYISK